MLFLQTHGARLSVAGLLLALLAVLGAFADAWSATGTALFVFILLLTETAIIIWQHRRIDALTTTLTALTIQNNQNSALLDTYETAWCLFNREGVMLSNNLHQHPLLDHNLNHFDDLVAQFEDSASLIEHFRELQKKGTAFTLTLTTITDNESFCIKGRSSAIHGHDYFCVLHFSKLRQAPPAIAALSPPLPPDHTVLDALPFPLWIKDQQARLVWVNACYALWYGEEREAIIANQLELLLPPSAGHPRSAAKLSSGRDLALSALQHKSVQEERGYRVINEKRRLVAYTERPLPPQLARDSHALIGMAEDITAAAETTEELRRHITAHHEVLENLGTPITIYGQDQRLEFYNRAYLRLWDHDEEFLDSKPSFGEILEDLRARRRAPEQADFQRYKRERIALFTSLLESNEDMMHLPDGSTLRVVAVPHPFGGVMFLHEDVTDKLALESSYNTLIAVQRETLDNLAEGIAVFGADGKLKLSNPSYAHIWQLHSPESGEEPHINDLVEQMRSTITREQWDEFRNTMISCALERTVQDGQVRRADGSVIRFKTVPLPDGAILNSYIDITDSLKVEQALRESNAALATADRLKSEFVANVSYQLRTPLHTIMGFAEILANQYFGTLNERQLEYAHTIMESSKRLKLLIDDVIDLAMVDAGRLTMNRQPTEIIGLLQSVVGMMGEWARQQSLELAIDTSPGIGSFVVDEKRIKQVLFNLISNSIQYTPPGGHITIQARQDKSMIHLSVIDDGIGIPPEDQQIIWNKFSRSNTQTRQSGVGLGLALVKSFIELHAGHIEINSQVKKGTRITCIIPIRPDGNSESQ